MYSHLTRLLTPENVAIGLYYTENELNEALGELKRTNIIYAGENKRTTPIDFKDHFPLEIGLTPPDSYVVVVKK